MKDKMTIAELLETSNRIADAHGFTARIDAVNPSLFSEKVLLMVGELVEAMEEFRAGRPLTEIYTLDGHGHTLSSLRGEEMVPGAKPEGVPIELADCVIRIADFCASNGIDLEGAIRLKHAYNEGRPHKHGKQF